MRNAIPLLVVLGTLAAAALNARPAEPVNAGRIYLHIDESGTLPPVSQERAYPLLTIGAPAPTGKSSGSRSLNDALAVGDPLLVQPWAGGRVIFQLVTPVLNSFEFWEPVALERRGNDLTLRVESWADDAQRLRNVPRRSTFFLSSYQLEAGDYTLRLEVQDLFCQSANGRPIYVPAGLRIASTQLTIAAAGNAFANRAGAPLPMINAADLKPQPPVAAAAVIAPTPRQHVAPTLIGLDLPEAKPGLRVGTFDLNAYRNAPVPVRGRALPELLPADPAGTIYAVVLGPQLNSGEYLTANRVEWRGRECIVTVDLWQDDGERAKNIVHDPLLVIPLLPAGAPVRSTWAPGEYKVTLHWNFLHASGQGGLYAPRANEEFVKKTATDATFTVK